MKSYLIDVPVLIIFWARPNPLKKVFEQVKHAKPSKLYLYQDGPRLNNADDVENIRVCRSIVENIDWDCEVHKLYQEKNYGCDPSMFIAIKWIFDHVDRAIILEDDCVPAQSFFPFCSQLLEKYYNDTRINMICGMNQLNVYEDSPYSYLFTKSGSISGWATWKRNVDLWEEHLDFLENEYANTMLKTVLGEKPYTRFIDSCKKHRDSGRAHFESIMGSSVLLNNRLNIVPIKNMISNIGIVANATHSVSKLNQLAKGIRCIFFMKVHEMSFPLKHPIYVVEDGQYKKKVDRIMGNGYPLVNMYRKCESVFYRLIAGDFSSLIKGLKRRLGL